MDEAPRMDVADAQFSAEGRLDRPARIVEAKIAAAIDAFLVDELVDGMVQRLDADKDPDVELRGAEIEARPVLEPQRIDVARLIARDAGGVGPARRRRRPVVRERARQLLADAVIARIETCLDLIGQRTSDKIGGAE